MAKFMGGKKKDNLAGWLIIGAICFPVLIIYLIFKTLEEVVNLFNIFSVGKVKQNFNIRFSENIQTQLNQIDSLDGWGFENYIACLLKNTGYKNVNVTSGSGDFGADIIAERNGVKIAFQCKRFSDKVGPKVVGEVLRGMNRYKCTKGIIVTNNYFTDQAIKEASISNIELWDRDKIINILKNEEKENVNINQLSNIKSNKKVICPYCKTRNNSERSNCWMCGKNILSMQVNNYNEPHNGCEIEPHKKDSSTIIGNKENKYISKINSIKMSAGEYDVPEDLKSGCYNIFLVNGEGSLEQKDKEKNTNKYICFGNKYSHQILGYNNLEITDGDVLEIKDSCVLEFEKVENEKADLNNIRAGIYKVPDNIESGKYKIILKNGEGSLEQKDKEKNTNEYICFGNKYSHQILGYNNLEITDGDVLEIKDSCVFKFEKVENEKVDLNNVKAGIYKIPDNIELGKYKIILKNGEGSLELKDKEKNTNKYICFGKKYSHQVLEYNNLKVHSGYVIEVKNNCILEFIRSGNIKSDENDKNIIELEKESKDESISKKDSYTSNTIDKSNEKLEAITYIVENIGCSYYSFENLLNELKKEGYNESIAISAIEICEINWNEQALKYAKENLEYNNYSCKSLINDLSYEKFTKEQIEYAVANCNVNWDEQALKFANEMIEFSDECTPNNLKDDLESEEFEEKSIKYAFENCKVDWNEQALKYAKKILEYNNYSCKSLINDLSYEKFTKEQIEYAIANCNVNWDEQALKFANEMIEFSDEYTPNDLKDDLESEEFEEKNIKYALKNCNVNWNEQAVKTAKKYRQENIYSREEIIEFLREDDGYTCSQAQYGMKN